MLIWWLGGKALSFVSALKFRYGRGWILCRRLEWARSAVSSRVALLLRSAEAKLLCYRFVQLCWTSLPFCTWLLRAKTAWFELGQMASRTGMRRRHEWRRTCGLINWTSWQNAWMEQGLGILTTWISWLSYTFTWLGIIHLDPSNRSCKDSY